jgi:hypothetical protein
MINSLRYSKCLHVGVLFVAFLFPEVLIARSSPPPPPSLVRKNDIMLLDEQHLRGLNGKKGWIVPEDFYDVSRNGTYNGHSRAVRSGRFGVTSGKNIYTTWRNILPLSNDQYTVGKKSIYDVHTSNLVMPAFEVKLDYITFLISGGYAPGKACINLLVDGKVVRSATGRNDDYLEWVAFDVKAFKGKKVQIQVLDSTIAQFGYITVDCVCQSPDTKEAVRVISTAPAKDKSPSFIETLDTKLTGTVEIKNSSLLVNGKKVDFNNLLTWYTGVQPGDANAKRIELINGDSIVTEVEAFENDNLKIKHAILGEQSLSSKIVAQVKFIAGPSVTVKPGTLLHSNGNKIPGEITSIRKENISIKCALGQLPLPRSRVNAFVFNDKKVVEDLDLVVLKDGSRLSGKVSLDSDSVILKHAGLGPIKLKIAHISQVTFHKTGIIHLSSLKSAVSEKTGPLPPPNPVTIKRGSQDLMRIFPRTVVRFSLGKSQSNRRFKAILKPVVNCSGSLSVTLRCGSSKKQFTVDPDSKGLAVDFDLKLGQELEMIVDTKQAVSYPNGIEWHKAIIIEENK